MDQNIQTQEIDVNSLPLTINRSQKGIPEEILITLRRKKLSYSQIAKIVGCSKPNVLVRLRGKCEEIELAEEFRRNKADIFNLHQYRISKSITPADRQKAGLLEKTKSICFFHNQEKVERGEATQIMGYADALKAKESIRSERQKLIEEKDWINAEFKEL